MAEQQETVEGTGDGQGRRRYGWYIAAVVLVLLLAVTSCTAGSLVYYRVGPERARFVVANARCIQCHTEMLGQLRLASTHAPFVRQQCTSCHNDHAELLEVTVTQGSGGIVSGGTWLRWGPFRRLIDPVQRAFFGVSKTTQQKSERSALGEATLVAPLDRLCWTCHGNLTPQRSMDFQHLPFAANQCVGCHDPHASDYKPLLNVSADVLCLTCHPIGTELNRKFAHQPALRRECLACHNAHASDWSGILVANQRDLCFTCHPTVARLSTSSVQHQPFAADDCTGCHEPHGADYSPLLNQPSPQVCYRCHTAIEPRFARESHHPVGTKLDCSSCHQPHASDFGGLLLASERQLCLGCHSDIAALTVMAVQHTPFETSQCTSCHTPHGSDYTPLLTNPQPNLCYMCHPALATAMSRSSHHPLQCSACHTVHASGHLKLLVAEDDNDFCYRCHSSISSSFTKSLHSPLECLKCHTPHGSQYGSLLVKSGPYVCVECHMPTEAFIGDGDLSHRASPEFLDAHAGVPLTCSSTCHDPHGTRFQHMTRTFPARWDGLCMQCHAGVGKRY